MTMSACPDIIFSAPLVMAWLALIHAIVTVPVLIYDLVVDQNDMYY